MLVLGRKVGEKIRIGDNITIQLLTRSEFGNGIRIGIDAPKDIPIDREEVYQRKQLEKAES